MHGTGSYIVRQETIQGFVRMNLEEYSRCDGVALADFVGKREVSPKELAQLFVEAVEKVNTKINAVIEVYSDRIEGPNDHAISAVPFARTCAKGL